MRFFVAIMLALGLWVSPISAVAQNAPGKSVRQPCGAGLVHAPAYAPRFLPVAKSPRQGLHIDFVEHSTFVLTSPQGVTAAPDYNNNYKPDIVPDIATMSGWHFNHTTENIEPSVRHPLRGWWFFALDASPPMHDVRLTDFRVYDVPANIRVAGHYFQFTMSVFVCEAGRICVSHQGVLSHVQAKNTLHALGRIDVLMVPVDQRVTLGIEQLVHNVKAINPRIVILMHKNAEATVEYFVLKMKSEFPVRRPGPDIF